MTAESPAAGKEPIVSGCRRLPSGVRLALQVPSDLAWFDGHFPGDPILPGVAQVGWAIRLAREYLGLARDPAVLEGVKFHRPVRPGATLELELRRDPACATRIAWRLIENGEAAGSGQMDFATGAG